MRRLLLSIIHLALAAPLFAQIYNASNTSSRIGIVFYVEDEKGFYHKKENINLDKVSDPISTYAYDKKTQDLYMVTKRGNCVVRVDDALAKYFKKSKTVPMLKEKELVEAIASKNKELAEQYEKYNAARQKHINDSIEKAYQDSIKRVRDDSIKKERERKEVLEYRNNHDWSWVPTKKKILYCELCEKNVTTRDSSLCYAIKNDTIYWIEPIDGYLGLDYFHTHVAAVSRDLKNNISYQYHNKVYRDSLENVIPIMSKPYAAIRNYVRFEEYLEKLRKKVPHGFFLDWTWDNEYSVSFRFEYLNTNKKTIKYIDVYWVIKNDVGDVRKSGHFSGTGPLKEWESASWNWEHSSYYVSGDASKMNLTKVIITYMDGTKVTIPKDKIYWN